MQSIVMFFVLLCLVSLSLSKVLHTSGRWILDEDNSRYKLRCVNWAGHLETNIPEGLQHQPVSAIAAKIGSANFNCVRLTYSIDMALSPEQLVSESFAHSTDDSIALPADMNALYTSAISKNAFLENGTTLGAFEAVINALETENIMVILDNHVSKAQWCCNLTDGNGWWDDAAFYNDANSRWFNTTNWLNGLGDMATFAKRHDNVVGMSLRNEMRGFLLQDISHADWYTHVSRGADIIHHANPDLLIMIGGTAGATNFGFQRTKALDTSAWAGKVVWEYHVYSYSVGYITGNCDIFKTEMGAAAGYLLNEDQAYTSPLWLSEFGVGLTGGDISGLNEQDNSYLTCLAGYMEGNDADWAIWAIQGDYYVRDGTVSYVESYGLLNSNWSDWSNPALFDIMKGMFNVTQGP